METGNQIVLCDMARIYIYSPIGYAIYDVRNALQ